MRLETFTFQVLTLVKDQKGMDGRWIKIASRNKGEGNFYVFTKNQRVKIKTTGSECRSLLRRRCEGIILPHNGEGTEFFKFLKHVFQEEEEEM